MRQQIIGIKAIGKEAIANHERVTVNDLVFEFRSGLRSSKKGTLIRDRKKFIPSNGAVLVDIRKAKTAEGVALALSKAVDSSAVASSCALFDVVVVGPKEKG